MKINEELEHLLGIETGRRHQARTAANSVGEGFESLFTAQMTRAESSASFGVAPEALRVLDDPLRLAGVRATIMGDREQQAAADDAVLTEKLAGDLTATLGELDRYSAALGEGSASLREAWGLLNSLDRNLAGLRQDMNRLSQPNAELDSMLNELEVLAATEKFRFNRGDYLSA